MSTTTRHPGCSASPCRDHRRRWRDRGRRRRSLRSHRRRALGSHPAEPLPAVRRRRHDAKRRTGMGWSYSSRATRHPLQALTLTGATLVAAIPAVLTTGLTTSPPGDVRLPWWLIALLYAGAEHNVALIRVRREAHTVSASEIPLVLGLAYASPGALLLARLVGSLAVLGACRRQRPLKLAVNLGAFLAETGVAIAAFYLVLGGQPLQGPRAWIAGLAAAAAGGATSAALITATVGVYEHDRRVASAAAGQAVSGALVATLVGTGGMLAVFTLAHGPDLLLPVLAAVVALLAGHRSYGQLAERHRSLQQLYEFSRAVAHSHDADRIAAVVLGESRRLLGAGTATLTLPLPGSGLAQRWTLSGTSPVRFETVSATPRGASVVDSGWHGPWVAVRHAWREHAARRRTLSAPVDVSRAASGSLAVTDRFGVVRAYTREHQRLLETIANHAAVAFDNSRLVERLRYETLHDSLTGLPNRVLLTCRLDEHLALPEAAAVVMLVDLDGFKDVNDTLGHQVGDLVLRELAGRLRGHVDDEWLVARLGGDEFALLHRGRLSPAAVRTAAAGALRCLARPVLAGDMEVEVGGSVGVAYAPDHARPGGDLLRAADLAMYAAKADGGGRDPRAQRGLVGELRRALRAGQLHVDVQPKIRLGDGRVDGVEALVRWRHPRRGPLGPDEFVPAAERAGLIGRLTAVVLETAVEECARWRDEGWPLGVAVNISARTLHDDQFPRAVRSLLVRNRLPSGMLTLEITEGSVLADPPRALAHLRQLHDLGVRLVLDDFGTGYSSLSWLRRLPVDQVKIDKGFVSRMTSDPEDAIIVQTVIHLAGNLTIETVAEGVEDEATVRQLRALGCQLAQGHHFSPSIPTSRLASWLSDWPNRIVDLGVAAPPRRPRAAVIALPDHTELARGAVDQRRGRGR